MGRGLGPRAGPRADTSMSMVDPDPAAEALARSVLAPQAPELLPAPALKPPRLVVRDIADVQAEVAASGPRRFHVRPLIVVGSYGIIGAAYKGQKTTDCADLIVSTASGTSWLDRFQVDAPGRVLAFFGEGDRAGILRWLAAVLRSRGGDLTDLHGLVRLCFRVPRFLLAEDLDVVRAEIETTDPRLVIVDPAYLGLAGAKGSALFDMATALEALQFACEGRTLVLAWHWNQTGSGAGAARFTGAGAAEWGRFLGSAQIERRVPEPGGWELVQRRFEFTGGEIPTTEFRVIRRVRAEDPDDPDSPLDYRVEVHDIEAAVADGLGPKERRVLAALSGETERLTVKEIGDRVASDRAGPPLKRTTINEALDELAAADLADAERPGSGVPNRWWRVAP
jgi:hypothetical protein